MHKSKRKIMTSFIAEVTKQNCSIIAIQEPWQNIHMNTTYCSSSCGYWPAYPKQFWSCACFLVSKKIPLFSWSVNHHRPGFSSLVLRLESCIVHIYNIYFQSSNAWIRVICNSSIYKLLQLLNKFRKHILMRNFNLHHSAWGSFCCLAHHSMAENLLRIAEEADLQLLTFSEIITWEKGNQLSTIDLIFCFLWLAQNMMSCIRNDRVENSLNYYSIFITFSLEIALQKTLLH